MSQTSKPQGKPKRTLSQISRPNSMMSHVTGQSRNRRFSTSQGQDLTRIQQHVYDRMEHIKPQKVRIDGFRIGDESSYGPFAWQITTPIKLVSSTQGEKFASLSIYPCIQRFIRL